MSYIGGVKSYTNIDLINHKIDYKLGNGIVSILNSCDEEVHPVTRHCDRTMLTQSIGILTSNTIKDNNLNLAKPKDLLSMMSSNGKENIETLDKVLKDYFEGNILLIY